MYKFTTGEYTLVFELYLPSASIDHSSVDISATNSIETISRASTNKSADHTRSLVLIHKYNNATPSNMMMDLALRISQVWLMNKI